MTPDRRVGLIGRPPCTVGCMSMSPTRTSFGGGKASDMVTLPNLGWAESISKTIRPAAAGGLITRCLRIGTPAVGWGAGMMSRNNTYAEDTGGPGPRRGACRLKGMSIKAGGCQRRETNMGKGIL